MVHASTAICCIILEDPAGLQHQLLARVGVDAGA